MQLNLNYDWVWVVYHQKIIEADGGIIWGREQQRYERVHLCIQPRDLVHYTTLFVGRR
ncbi:MAG TPA: hypothetical protein VH796_08990 [Nitrososphaeraceae archaeon]